MSDEHRVKIQNSNILSHLLSHAVGERDMTTTQVTVGLALMKKVLPDLSSITIEGGENPLEAKMTLIVTGVPRPQDYLPVEGKADSE